MILCGCGGSSGMVAGLSDDELRANYGGPAGEMDEAAGGGLCGGEYESDQAAPPSVNRPPVIESVSFVGDTITVIATDPDGDALSYCYIVLSGEVVVSPQGDGSSALAATLLDGEVACGVKVIVSDGRGGEDSATVRGVASAKPQQNSILMLFDRVSVGVHEPVTITVYAYELAEPLMYLNSAMIELNGFAVDTADGKFDVNAMNLGALGGAVGFPDGLWADIADADYALFAGCLGLFGPHDASYFVDGEQVPAGRKFLGVNVSPVFATGAIPAGSSGPLFNFTLVAESSGIATFKFVREYRQVYDGALLAGTLYSSTEYESHTFFDQQMVAVEVAGE